MNLTVEATYENGALKLAEPLPLKEHDSVRVTVQTPASPLVDAYAIMGWTGSAEELERLAMDPEFEPLSKELPSYGHQPQPTRR